MNKIIIVGLAIIVLVIVFTFFWLLLSMRAKKKLIDSLPNGMVQDEYMRDVKNMDDRFYH